MLLPKVQMKHTKTQTLRLRVGYVPNTGVTHSCVLLECYPHVYGTPLTQFEDTGPRLVEAAIGLARKSPLC